jgi:hypothetical protein
VSQLTTVFSDHTFFTSGNQQEAQLHVAASSISNPSIEASASGSTGRPAALGFRMEKISPTPKHTAKGGE